MIKLENVCKNYRSKAGQVTALDFLSLNIKEGEFTVIRGASGSGKTTLLLTIGAMLRPDSGKVLFGKENIYAFNGRERNRFRAQKIGFVFQMFHLLPYLTLLENVAVTALGKQKKRAKEMLVDLGLGARVSHKPYALSAGEKQRTAVARALINQPKIVLADEPTGNLDPENSAAVIDSFVKYHNNGGTVIVVTHGTEADTCADRVLRLKEGSLLED